MNKNYIFLADDDEDDRMLFSEALNEQRPDSIILTFDNGVDLMASLLDRNQKLPDIIFLDLNMPLMNGEECLADIRREPSLAAIPVVIYSTYLDPKMVDAVKDGGANKYLKKPKSFPQLKESLEKAINSVLEEKYGVDSEFIVRY
ncbi:response regulator [Arenibacter certesii]|uniref:Response regulator n=1 Tax=Arenibacter certesii TaxID=228955 RepID=A0A918J3P7_9FLAO|nr:response regulator [Arenibacter certesii]GGW41449.1 response regulator [Arenibacter certesii]